MSNFQPWAIGSLTFKRPGEPVDDHLWALALELSRRTANTPDPIRKAAKLLAAVQDLYGDLPQTWACWRTYDDYRALSKPYELRTFMPDDTTRADWLKSRTAECFTIMFMVPLRGHICSAFSHVCTPEVPGPALASQMQRGSLHENLQRSHADWAKSHYAA